MPVTALSRDIKLVAVGKSRGVRLPRDLLRKCGISDALVLEERPEGILLRGTSGAKMSLDQPSEVAVDQIRRLSKSRLGKCLGRIDALIAADVRAVIRLLYAES